MPYKPFFGAAGAAEADPDAAAGLFDPIVALLEGGMVMIVGGSGVTGVLKQDGRGVGVSMSSNESSTSKSGSSGSVCSVTIRSEGLEDCFCLPVDVRRLVDVSRGGVPLRERESMGSDTILGVTGL